LKLRTGTLRVVTRGEAVIPDVDPTSSGLRLVVDSAVGAPTLDVTVPGGPAWRVNERGTRWKYTDPAGAIGGVRKIVVRDRSHREPGLVRWTIRTFGGDAPLPDPADLRTTVSFGTSDACAAVVWGGPDDPRPRCTPKNTRLRCR
jgi:hypothetical protein